MATEDVDAVSSFGRRMKVKTKKMEARIESVRHETNVDDPERDIAASLLEESKEELERRVKLWPIVILAREADLVDDVFVDSLMKQGSSANSNTTNLWMFISKIKEKESWFSRFLNVLSISPSYRPLAEQLSRNYHYRLAENRGICPSLRLLEILHKAVETLKKCKEELQKALEFHRLVSVQHCVNVLGMAVDHLQFEVRSTEAQNPTKVDDKSSLVERSTLLSGKSERDSSTHPPRVGKDQSSSKSPVVGSKRQVSRVKDDSVTTQHSKQSHWSYSEVQVVHEVLKHNRGYLELKIPIDAIIPQLHAQDLLLDYEYAEVTSQRFPIRKNRSLIDAFLRKAPSVFYQFCKILEGQHGYEYIAHHLLREVQDLDPHIPLGDKMNAFGISWSPGPKRTGPRSKNVPQTVDALVDGDMLNKCIQSIFDKQMEMAEDVKRVHQMEVFKLKESVSEAKDKVDVVKAECTALVQQVEQGKVDSSGHVSALQGKIQEIIQVCEDVQVQKSANTESSVEALIDAMNLERRIGHLTTTLEKKEKELQIWKGTAERREGMLFESQKRCSDLEMEHKTLRRSKEKEIETLQNNWEASQERTAAVTRELSASQERYGRLVAEYEELKLEHADHVAKYEELRVEYEELGQERARNIAKYKELKENSGKEIKKLISELERISKENSELRLMLVKERRDESKPKEKNCISNTSKDPPPPVPSPVSWDDVWDDDPDVPPWDSDVSQVPYRDWDVRGYYGPLELNEVDADKQLQKEAISGEHLVRKEGEGNLKLSVWQDGTCYHLQIYQKKDKLSRASYSLDKKVYFRSIKKLCKHYTREPLPGYAFKLR